MNLCEYNPQLLKYDWSLKLVDEHCGKTYRCEKTALMRLFESKHLNEIDLNSEAFRKLFNVEKDLHYN